REHPVRPAGALPSTRRGTHACGPGGRVTPERRPPGTSAMSDPVQPASVYDLSHKEAEEAQATFAVLVDNEPGVLHRVVGLFAARGYNIESLTVAETDRRAHTSRVTIVTRGTPHVLSQIEAQLQKMVSTRHVQDVTKDPN